jgi:hypothetical protein
MRMFLATTAQERKIVTAHRSMTLHQPRVVSVEARSFSVEYPRALHSGAPRKRVAVRLGGVVVLGNPSQNQVEGNGVHADQ